MRIALHDTSCLLPGAFYAQMNWHGDFYRDYTANGDSFTVQTGDAWGIWLSGPLACNTPHSYHWNAQWGHQFFDELGAPNGGNPPLGLYYAHGRWYNQDTGLYLSPDEKGSYIYLDNDPVNKHVKPRGVCSPQLQTEPSDCEKFVDEVRRFISLAQAAGAGDGLTVKFLAQYYSGIPATWQFGPLTLAAIGGVYNPNPGTPFSQVLPFPVIQDRWVEPNGVHLPLDSQEGQEIRRKYGFKRIFFTNTHHHFAEFYSAWFWGSTLAEAFSTERERRQTNFEGQPYFEGAADIAVADVARRHVERIQGLEGSPIQRNALAALPQLLAQDACAKSDQEIFSNWPPPNIEKILGPAP